jgi:hypothetical protein
LIGRRRTAFLSLCTTLRAVEADLEDLDAVKELNLGVLTEILRDEAHIVRLRGLLKDLTRRLKTERPTRAGADALRRQIRRHELAIERYTRQLFVWRCLADGLVYAYISTFNVKHAFFDTATIAPKPSAGFIGGKDGLAYELLALKSALDHHVPAVLSDITNIIRYGDICLLGGGDPVPIEVKSRPALNQRGRRQAAKLAQLEAFLNNDRAEGFRGMPEMRRVAYVVPHRGCVADLNDSIQAARRDGWNVFCPERGLVYAAIFEGSPIEEMFRALGMKRPAVFMLNRAKNDLNWAPYLPFTSSIRNPLDLYDFLVGNLTLIVVVDLAVLCDRLATPGWKASLVDDEFSSILMEHAASGAKLAISTQFVGRLGFEFMSMDWFVEHEAEALARLFSEMGSEQPDDGSSSVADEWSLALAAMPRLYETSEA